MNHILLFVILVALVHQAYCFADGKCTHVYPDAFFSGQLNLTNPTDCYIIPKPPCTKELVLVDTMALDDREAFYICSITSTGASGQGCSSDYHQQGEAQCLTPLDGKC